MLRLQLMLALFVAIGASSQPTCRGNDGACSVADDVGLMQKPGPSNSQLNRKAQKSTVELLQNHMGASFQGASSVPALSLAMGQLAADVVAGKTVITDATKKALQGIWEEMEAVFTSAKETQAADLELVKAVADAVEACDQPVVGNKDWGKDAASKNTDHNTCRTSEEDLKETMDTECLEYETAGKNPNVPSCLATFPANPSLDEIPSMMACVDKIAAWSAEYKQKLAKEKSECDEASKNHQDKVPVCNQAQSTYESHFCSYHETLTSRCDSYIECRREKGDAQQTTHDAVDVSLASRNSESRAARHIQCFLGVLNATATTQPNLLNGCVSRIESSKDQPAQFEIPTIQEHPALDCDKSPVESKPCDSQWISTYEAQPWFQKSPTVACSECAHLQVSETDTKADEEAGSDATATEAPAETWHQGNIAVGQHGACALKEDGTAVCWGRIGNDAGDYQHEASLPANGKYYSIVRKDKTACGIRKPERTLQCAGREEWKGTENDKVRGNVQFKKIALGSAERLCGIKVDNTLFCLAYKFSHNFPDGIPDGEFANIDCGRNGCCGVKSDGSLVCFGRPDDHWGANSLAPKDQFVDVAVGDGGWQCALKSDRTTVQCWGKNYNYPGTGVQLGTTAAEGMQFDSIEAWHNNHIGRGLMHDGTLQSWGDSRGLKDDKYPGGNWKAIDSDSDTACGIRPDGSALCWSSGQIRAGGCFHSDGQSCDTPQGVSFKVD